MRSIIAGKIIAATAGALMAAAFAWAQTPGGTQGTPGFADRKPPMQQAMGGEDGKGPWWNNLKTVEQLKLTDDQRKAMDSILMEHRKTLIDLKATLEKAELGMQPLLSADQPNETQVLAQIDKVAQARADLEKANARFLLGLRRKITPEQWKQLQELHSGAASRGWQGQNRGIQKPGTQQQPQQRPGTHPSGQPGGQPSGPSGQPGDQPDQPDGPAPSGTGEQL
jgi:periplasmic protein CpxP/Spy